ncbi:tRNA lysidine(34) synthetase [Paramaledivibacter caminithermalis]|jgi:tRNA(Ile)-lysidine synthase TilS/MesJ|uniref:tRNA(Ile)-lysidine synthase TilS/MesJ n=1 Tax=Paramaledivibacter caminithermalis (strain DSM 15212 / CIP 107654 / DViRD3) TaxID=1121301 RepID=A0A1M6M0Z3_PARC5|nr:ATP-binding protein [Paramaledivibacter caminithermalis]SHJ77010.1 tRNA(Ile)-lysidine synthase TilS/MesJ [Paramaledivibacter caminithermalis DSM 15212]
MKKWYNKLFLNDIRRAIDDYNMIKKDEKIIVGLSGGKDSILLIFALNLLSKYSHKSFEVIGVHLDCGFDMNIEPLKRFCQEKDIRLYIEETNIIDYLNFEGDKNPCYLCGRLRRGALGRIAKKLGVQKIALGHHMDDVVETFFMNMIYTGKLGTFHPKIYEPKKDIFSIRPLVYVKEENIKKVVEILKLPVITSRCPKDGCTSRQEMKLLISTLEKNYPDIKEKIITSLSNIDMKNIWRQRRDCW